MNTKHTQSFYLCWYPRLIFDYHTCFSLPLASCRRYPLLLTAKLQQDKVFGLEDLRPRNQLSFKPVLSFWHTQRLCTCADIIVMGPDSFFSDQLTWYLQMFRCFLFCVCLCCQTWLVEDEQWFTCYCRLVRRVGRHILKHSEVWQDHVKLIRYIDSIWASYSVKTVI